MKLSLKLLVVCFFWAFIHNSCKKEYSCENCLESNRPPIANAGRDTVITLPVDSLVLDGTKSTDPDGQIINYKWNKISGPTSSNISEPSLVKTPVKTLATGIYRFELTVTDDGNLSAKDTVQIIVDDPAVNQPPIANAGTDQITILPKDSVSLDGTLSLDPDGTIVSYQWTKITGPASLAITNATAPTTVAKNLAAGIYQFQLKVTDNGG